MQTIKYILQQLFILLFLSSFAFSGELVNEQFISDIDGWSVSDSSKVYHSSSYSGSLFIDKQDSAYKTYSVGTSYANTNIDISINWCATNTWENNNDYLKVKINGGNSHKDYNGGGCQTYSFSDTTDSNGNIKIYFKANSNKNNEDAYIEDFTISTPTPIGCNDSLDTSTNYSNPGPAIPLLDGATNDITTCISGTLDNSSTEYYHFTVQTAGTLTMTTSSPDNTSYDMGVAGYVINDIYWMPNSYYRFSNTFQVSHSIPSIHLNAGDSIYIVFKSYSVPHTYQANLTFLKDPNIAPIANAGADQTVIQGISVTLDGSGSSDDSGTSNLSYSWNDGTTTLTGMNPSITGLALGDHIFTLTVTDIEGLSSTDTVTIKVISSPPHFNGTIPNQTVTIGASYTFDTSTYFTPTDGDTITYTVSSNLPTGITIDSATGVLSGISTAIGTFNNIIITATDKDGSVNSNNFSISLACSRILDTPDASSNASNPSIIGTMNGITADTSTCISGASTNSDNDYYYFEIGTNGTLDITASSPNNHSYSLRVGTSTYGGEYYPRTLNENHTVSQIDITAGNRGVYIYLRENGSNTDEYQINFNFVKSLPQPPKIASIPDQFASVDTAFSLDISSFTTEPDGDVITYSSSSLPVGLTFDINTGIISGTLTVPQNLNITVTAADKDGVYPDGSSSQTFLLTVITPPVANAGADQTVISGTTVTLDGSASTGNNLQYTWELVEGGTHYTSSSYSSTLDKSGLSIGTHILTLTVTDANNNTSTDTVSITITPAPIGCDNSLDFDNHSSPGQTLVALDGATSDVATCISGDSHNGDSADFYKFTVATTGILSISTSSPNNNQYHLKVGSNPYWDDYYPNKTRISHNVNPILLKAGDSVYLYVVEAGNNRDEYEINLDFKVGIGCDNSLDDDNTNHSNPGAFIPLLHGATTHVSTCISGALFTQETEYYQFTVQTAGTMTITTSSPTNHTYSMGVAGYIINDKYSMTQSNTYYPYTDRRTYSSHTIPPFDLKKGDSVYVIFQSYSPTDTYQANFNFVAVQPEPPKIASIPAQSAFVGMDFSLDLLNYVSEPDGDVITYSSTSLPAGLVLNSSTGVISGIPTQVQTISVTVTASDKEGTYSDGSSSQTFDIIVTVPAIDAVNDSYSIVPGNDVTGNLCDNDKGANIFLTSHTSANTDLTVSSDCSFIYKGGASSISFNYTIQDSFGQTDTALVTINAETIYKEGTEEFTLINPINTRNIIGGYTILGNTIECITNERSSYGGACQDSNAYNDNNYMAKYLDTDKNIAGTMGAKTWNSSSSNLILPNSYEQQGGKGILWAAIFWQGALHNEANAYPQRRGYVDGDGYALKDITTDESLDMESTDANKLLIGVDEDTAYTQVQATKFYYDREHGVEGGYYAAYSDITQLLQNKNLAEGKHKITVANLTTTEGRQSSTGNYGGWSIVVIYKENELDGDATNVSIYEGYTVIPSSSEVKISGFKLPNSGNVNAKFSSFAGEGEHIYKVDRMVMKRLPSDTGDKMPGATDSDNIFDAILANISRDPEDDNDVINANGIDVDSYDVSEIITKYRDADSNLNAVYISLYSSGDYITPSMMAFSTALYQPNICYDYTLDIDGFIIPSIGNVIQTSYGAYNKPLQARISVQSKEGDFKLHDVNLSYRIDDTDQLTYNTGTTYLAPDNIYDYIPAGLTGLNQTYGESPAGFSMYIGDEAKPQPGGPGGIIDAYQARYFKFDMKMLTHDIDTRFRLWIEYTVDYGSGPLTLSKGFGEASLCQNAIGYYPAWGIFNVSSDTSSITTGQPYNLHTQIASRTFNARVFSFESDVSTLLKTTATVEVEVYNAGLFSRDTNTSCFNPDSNVSAPVFVNFDDTTSVPLTGLRYDFASQNVGFRTWYLTGSDGSFITQNCTNRNDETCFQNLYQANYPRDTYCTQECSTTGSGCYPCLRRYYGRIICSRDNFAIRPEAFKTTLIDSLQIPDTTAPNTSIADSARHTTLPNTANLAAEYQYRFDVVATNYINDDPTPRYVQLFNQNSLAISSMQWSPRGNVVTGCVDTNDTNVNITMYGGTSTNGNTASLQNILQVGNYDFTVRDSNWTVVDWDPAQSTHHTLAGFSTTTDCLISNISRDINSTVLLEGRTGKQGCVIESLHTAPRNNKTYRDLALSFYPYTFNTAGLTFGTGPSNRNVVNDFVYINTLATAQYPNGIDENMSFNIGGTYQAAGFNGGVMTNFVDNCYAQNLNMELNHTYPAGVHIDVPLGLTYDLVNFNTSNPSTITRARTQNTFATATTPLVIQQNSADFTQSMQGAISMDLGFNFNRTLDTPLNPRFINFQNFNISYVTQPNLSANGINNYQITGGLAFNQNVSFLYASAKPAKTFYENVEDVLIRTPVSIVVYCDLGPSVCASRGIDTLNGQTNESDWWLSTGHQTFSQDGNILLATGALLEGAGNPLLAPTSPSILTNGTDQNIRVSVGNNPTYPMTVPINLITDIAQPNYTNRWLLYNPNSAIAIANPFYRVRFINNAFWTGLGQTGNVVGTGANKIKTKRLDW